MPLSKEEISQIATRTADEVVERMRGQMEIRDIVIGCAIGEGAIPLYSRETRKESCAGCRIDPTKPLEAGNVMATTNDAIGTLSRDEVRRWCSEIIEVADGRCARARAIRTAAKECKEKHPDDTEAFFRCYAPAFSQATKGSNPVAKEPQEIEQEGREIAQRLGVRYLGPQYDNSDFLFHLFNDDEVTGTSFAGNTYEEAKANLAQKRALFEQERGN